MSEASFTLNGRRIALQHDDPRESLLRWLKRHALHGTKEGCADGDCGACTVVMRERGADGRAAFHAVNSCLVPVGVLPDREVITVEALANGDALHPVQQAMVDCAGSQCGYCTPGFVMSLFAGFHAGTLDDETIAGNLCRCTGYQPIRAAAAQLAATPRVDPRFAPQLATRCAPLPAATLGAFASPVTIADALALKAATPGAQWLAGATDIGVALSHGTAKADAFIALDRIDALREIVVRDDAVRIGAGVPLARIEHELTGLFPTIDALLPWFAAGQVRRRATIGGNLGTASPIGDLLPVLLALDSTIELAGRDGTRRIAADAFFVDYRKTARADDELIVAVELPRDATLVSATYKVAKRQTDDISIVAAVFAIRRDAQRRVTHARLAYGGVAAVPNRAHDVEAFLQGRVLDDATVDDAVARLQRTFTPLSDHRAGAAYRAQLCGTLFAKFVAEHLA